jgi:NRPS condensation-like uncharacterized protein
MNDRAPTSEIPQRIPANAGDLTVAAMGGLYTLELGCRLTIKGRLDTDVLARAVRQLLDAVPVLGCSALRVRLLGSAWERCTALDGAEYFSVVWSDDPDRDGVAFHSEALRMDGPRLVARLLRSHDADDVCLKVDHRVADGWSVKELTCLLAETYTRVACDRSWIAEPDLSPRPTHADLRGLLTPAQRRAARRTPGIAALSKWKMSLRRGRRDALSVRRLTLSPDRFLAIKAHGKVRGATVNDMLVTAMTRSLARMFPPAPGIALATYITSDLRRYVDAPAMRRVCNLSSAALAQIACDPRDDFDEALERVMRSVRPWKDCLWWLKGSGGTPLPYYALCPIMSAAAVGFRRRGMNMPVMMNAGVLEEGRLGFGDALPVAAHVLGSTLKVGGFAATVSTYRDTLTVWMGSYERDLHPALLEQALHGMDAELRRALERAGSLRRTGGPGSVCRHVGPDPAAG